ncbi:CLUMA_CG004496, isoform A [Clunio marinus]|uniref:CLUMA_CG004496, isoform A n=1 Tax=Clunio marinus TaxID=568069 RepID=A0A1J1HWB6_9DIPT|nr:CLUMA_CG004496, isoform A [Clunio marinus]
MNHALAIMCYEFVCKHFQQVYKQRQSVVMETTWSKLDTHGNSTWDGEDFNVLVISCLISNEFVLT